MKEGLLYKTRCYTVGPMEFADSHNKEIAWRDYFKNKVSKLGIITLSPYEKTFINFETENAEFRRQLALHEKNRNFDAITEIMKKIRRRDLAMVDMSTFIVGRVDPEVHQCGTFDEVFHALDQRKPVFLFTKDKAKISKWLFGCLPHQWIFDGKHALDEIIQILYDINSGQRYVDSKYWRLLEYKYR